MITYWHSRSVFLSLLVLPCTLLAGNTSDPGGLPTYHSTVSEVRVAFFATDGTRNPVTTVAQSDFAVVDNEHIVRDFRSFSRTNETSLDVVALVDQSESVAPRFGTAINSVLQLVTHEQSIPDGGMAVLSFGGTSNGVKPVVLCSDGCGASDSVGKLMAVKSGGMTPLFDALIFGSEYIAQHRRPGARTALIVFSDGNDTSSLHTSREALQAVLASEALVYAVDIGGPRNNPAGKSRLLQLSDATGGLYFSLSSTEHADAATVLTAVFEDLRASYVVTYEPASRQAGFHFLRLLPTQNLNLTFHSRNGYYYEPSVR